MPSLHSERQAIEQRMRADHIEGVPAHVRNFQARVGRRDAIDFARDPAQPFGDFVFAPALGQQLHAHTDAEKRPALAAHRVIERLDHAVDRIEAAPAIGKGADAGQHHAIGAYDRITWNFIRYIARYRRQMAPRVRELIAGHADAAQVVVLRSRRAARRYLAAVAASASP